MRPEVEVNAQIEGGLAAEVSTIVLDTLEHLVQVSVVYLLTPASPVEVGCPWARGLYRNYTSRRKNTHRHANLRPAPHYSTRHTEARSPVEIKCTNPRNKEKKSREGGGDLKPRRGGREGNQEKPYATRTPRHANKASSTTQTKRRRMACACATATYRWTGICPHANEQW